MADIATVKRHLSEASAANVERWLTEPKYAMYLGELETLIADEQWQTLEDSFFKVIEFGTAGRRGTTGIGPNRINKVTIGESAQALCQYILSIDSSAAEKGIAIAYDTRLSSPTLSTFVAQVCAANGFKTYLFDGFRSTPELSFTVRHLGCAAGIVISASHNPPSDNGFKVCWSDGGQMVSPHDKGVMGFVERVEMVDTIDFDAAVADARIIMIGADVDEAYIAAASAQAEGTARDLKIVYSPLHGAGQTNTLPVLRTAGFGDITVVEDQMVPDGNFPTVENNRANPEDKAANDRAVAQMLAEDADIAITNDPDADRVGVMVRHGDTPIYLSGNQASVLAADFVLGRLQAKGQLTPKHYIAKTMVTTDMLAALADRYGVTLYTNMLVGFKYIGSLLQAKDDTDEVFVLGCEESFGMLKGTYARDKDGATGALPVAEYAAELKLQGKTLWDRLLELYAEHGLYAEQLINVVSPGAQGFQRMQEVMASLRSEPPASVNGHTLTAVSDYATLVRTDTATGETTPIDCATGNVVVLEFGDARRRLTIRPSGTEPKLKIYAQWFKQAQGDDIAEQYEQLHESLETTCRELEGLLFEHS